MNRVMRIAACAISIGVSGCGLAPARRMSADEGALVEAARKLAARKLKDPDSAAFRNGLLQRNPRPVGAAWRTTVVCGEINGRNSFGAYTGFRRFIAEPGAHLTRLEPIQPDAAPFAADAQILIADPSFETDWAAACQGRAPAQAIDPF